ncbi:hypothetical protein BBP40_000424 [Aspergillus hancockii]|nr:hypothetical protein BBP40_000424 [Aspergillus hancockii]
MASTNTRSNIREIQGDLFDAPDGAALIQACNCLGSWGNGIARYPTAFAIYRSYCEKYRVNPEYTVVSAPSDELYNFKSSTRRVRLPEGTALIISPQEGDCKVNGKKHWIICLLTSWNFGRRIRTTDVIIQNTQLAIADMMRQLEEDGSEIGELWSCRFNSGLFGVKWELSRAVLEETGLDVTVAKAPAKPTNAKASSSKTSNRSSTTTSRAASDTESDDSAASSSDNGERSPSEEPDYILAEITNTGVEENDVLSSEPAIPPKLLTKLVHHHFKKDKTKLAKDANEVVAKYVDVFVREALARAAFERVEGNAGVEVGIGDGFLEVEDLEKMAPQLVLDF